MLLSNSPVRSTTPQLGHSSTDANPGCDHSRSSTSTPTGPASDSASTLPVTSTHWKHSTATVDPAIQFPPIAQSVATTVAAAARGCYFLEEIDFVGECFSLHVRMPKVEKVEKKEKNAKRTTIIFWFSTVDASCASIIEIATNQPTRHYTYFRNWLVAEF